MQNGLFQVRDSQHFKQIEAIKNVPENAILDTADVVGLCPYIPHQAGLTVPTKALERERLYILKRYLTTEDLVKMAEFVLNNDIFEFNSKVYQ